MARNPIFSATLQAALLGATSNILAQLIEAYRKQARIALALALALALAPGTQEPRRTRKLTSQTAIEVDWIPVFQFLMFSIISTPPNFLWQDFLESSFPARARAPPAGEASAAKSKAASAREPLSIRNTLLKFGLDQTVGAAFNTLLFSVYIHSIHLAMPGAPRITNFTKATGYWISPGVIDFSAVDMAVVWRAALAEFWTIVLAGMKLWPAVSLVNFTLVKTVEGRNLVGCVAGLGWGVYMSMIAAKE